MVAMPDFTLIRGNILQGVETQNNRALPKSFPIGTAKDKTFHQPRIPCISDQCERVLTSVVLMMAVSSSHPQHRLLLAAILLHVQVLEWRWNHRRQGYKYGCLAPALWEFARATTPKMAEANQQRAERKQKATIAFHRAQLSPPEILMPFQSKT